jgi:hypothetical protein
MMDEVLFFLRGCFFYSIKTKTKTPSILFNLVIDPSIHPSIPNSPVVSYQEKQNVLVNTNHYENREGTKQALDATF